MLLIRLARCQDADAPEICNSLYGVRLLAESKSLTDTISSVVITPLLALLTYMNVLDVTDTCNLFYGMGTLAQANGLEGSISAAEISQLLAKFLQTHGQNLTSRNADTILEGLKLLHQADGLHGEIDRETFTRILIKSTHFQPLLCMLQGAFDPSSIFSELPQELIQLIGKTLLTSEWNFLKLS